MSRIPVQTLDTAPEQTRPTLERLTRRTGKLLNIHAEMAHAPVVLAAYAGITEALAEQSSFDARTREAIALAVGAQDGCDYCQAAHTPSAIKSGLSEAQTIAIRRGELAFDPKLAALLAVVREAAANVGEVSDATWTAAQQAGWSDVQLSEAFAHLAVNLFTNFFNHYARTDLDLPAAPALTP
ncbi:carboxymuconolactone decarboxylase family protein [Jatrophihabitans lederbergiae]|jgi:AhpD family alkylhydroperoxidase|uniref:Carboxymuconolactone decarboxylase family protein n=1 Tax=Jatrophihabitans lederbergiae TaxID=3075547 RepID=A0ABU2J969_9ACTN|nr:carboxymuconolactone decarboxylase family protein [Jatrophihabitans sp. DSM 44399]MDT0261502.1 carboxymuconolactone decarboxylase family protein [Jatrophihabitans sp. DSM 44399]